MTPPVTPPTIWADRVMVATNGRAMKRANPRSIASLARSSEHRRLGEWQAGRFVLAVRNRGLRRPVASLRQEVRGAPRAGLDVDHRHGVVVARKQPCV